MGLSKNAARTLEQVKSGLSILYGADYFTEDEWIKLDGLIHKGNYVFTSGPRTNILDEELMSFDDFEDTILPIPTAPMQNQPTAAPKHELHHHVPTTISENPSLNFSESLPNDNSANTSANTSTNASADEECTKVDTPTIAEKAPEAVIAAAPASKPAPANGGLAWYTQAQLDEVKAFNANLTKAGQKDSAKKGRGGSKHTPSVIRGSAPPPRSSYGSVLEQNFGPQSPVWGGNETTPSAPNPVNQTPGPNEPAAWNAPQLFTGPQPACDTILEKGLVPERPAWETGTEIPETEFDDDFPFVAPNDTSSINHTFPAPQWPEEDEKIENPLPTSAEQESRISSWADEVNAEGTTPIPVFDPNVQEPLNPRFTNGTDNFPELIEKFTQVHGKKPRVVNDFHQPRNPAYKGPMRPDSRASVRTTTRSVIPSKTRTLETTSGTIILAHSNAPKRSNICIEVRAGDSIKYLKHVSGIMHTGMNLRTKQQGQFPETVLEPVPSQTTLIQQQRSVIRNIHERDRGDTFTSALSHSLDRVESTNAAVWEGESEASRPTTSSTQAVAPVPLRTNGALAGSRFAALAEMESQDGESERGVSVTPAELRRILREEFAHIPAATQIQRSRTVAPPPENILTNIIPKVSTCWFWKNKNDCRFTAEECIHLHADLPDGGEPTNLRFGKPTWGALADATIPPPSTIISKSGLSRGTAAVEYKRFSKSKTCYYWATDGKCNNTEEDCKYLHEYTEAGVAYKPGNFPAYKKDFNWSKVGRNGAVTEDTTSSPVQTLHTTEYGWGAPNGREVASEAAHVNTWDAPNESSAALMANPNANIWGAVEGSSAWDLDGNVYKPPHIKALEERERIEAVGW